MPNRRLHGSVNLIPEAPVGLIRDLAVEAERLGFKRSWVYDEGLATRDLYVTLTAIAKATNRLEVGPGITNAYTRHPAQTATAIATLDELSGGRAFLGLGAGGSLTLDPLALERVQPLETVRKTIEACRALFAGEVVDLDAPTFSMRAAQLGWARPELPIWVAGRGPRMLDLGGATADGVMLDFIYKPLLGDYVEKIRTGASRSGNEVSICYSTMVVTDDAALEEVRPHMTYRLVDSPAPGRTALGINDTDIATIRTALGDGLVSAARHVPDEWVLPFVIAGTVDECATELDALADEHSLDEFLLPIFNPYDGANRLEVTAQVLGGP